MVRVTPRARGYLRRLWLSHVREPGWSLRLRCLSATRSLVLLRGRPRAGDLAVGDQSGPVLLIDPGLAAALGDAWIDVLGSEPGDRLVLRRHAGGGGSRAREEPGG